MCLSAFLGLGSAAVGASSANKAAKSQERMGERQLEIAEDQFETTRADLAPFREAGGNALAAYLYEMGLGPAPTFGGSPMEITTIPGNAGQPGVGGMPPAGYIPQEGENRWNNYGRGGPVTEATPTRYSVGGQMFDTMEAAQAFANANRTGGTTYGGISMSPGTRFALEEGRDTLEAGAAARGGLNSGATKAALERLRMGMAAQDRETQLNRLGGVVDLGMNSAARLAANSANFTQNATNALGGIGNAQAAGAIGVGNALQGGIQNLAGVWGYQQAQQNALAPTTSLRPQARPW